MPGLVGPPPQLDIVVVAYGPEDQLDRCLSKVENQFPVLVVDNAGSPECAKVAAHHGARYLDPGRNLGFAAAVNLGIAERSHPDGDLLLLNPDALIAPR